MRVLDAYTIIVTPKVRECRDFYVRWLSAAIVFEASWFVLLAISGEPQRTLAFMAPDHPSSPPGPETFTGTGVFLTFQVADADLEYRRLTAAGASFAYPVRTEPWGQRRFALVDPSGTWLDVVQQIDPSPGFWDPYLKT